LNWVDFFIFVVLIIAFANGYRRGMFKEISTFIGLLITIVFALYYADWLSLKSEGRLNFSPSIVYLISFLIIFVSFQVFLKLLGHFFYKMVKITPLKRYDKIGGGGFGLIKGAFALSLIFLMFILFPKFQSYNEAIDQSTMAPVFRKIVPVSFDAGMQLHPRKAKFIDKVKAGILGSKATAYAQNPDALLEGEDEVLGMSYDDINVLNNIDKYFGNAQELAKKEE
jgi:membrane protein required for colicin V production